MSQGHTITRPYLQDQADPQSGTHTHAPCLQDCIEQIAGQGHTHTQHTLPTRPH